MLSPKEHSTHLHKNQEFDLGIVVPICNPAHGWNEVVGNSLKKIASYFEERQVKLIVVNDGSKETERVKKEFQLLKNSHPDLIFFVSYEKNRGKGFAIKKGLENVAATYYIYTDWDFPFGETSLKKVFTKLEKEKVDLVLSNRTKAYYQSLPLFRFLISKSLKFLNLICLNFRNVDTQAGLKGLNNKTKEIFLKLETPTFLFELELVKKCIRNKLTLDSIDVVPRNDIEFTNFGSDTLLKELKSFIKILFM